MFVGSQQGLGNEKDRDNQIQKNGVADRQGTLHLDFLRWELGKRDFPGHPMRLLNRRASDASENVKSVPGRHRFFRKLPEH
jgi:hypothetical protein